MDDEENDDLEMFDESAQEMAINLAAYEIVKEMIDTGMINGSIGYLCDKYKIKIEKTDLN